MHHVVPTARDFGSACISLTPRLSGPFVLFFFARRMAASTFTEKVRLFFFFFLLFSSLLSMAIKMKGKRAIHAHAPEFHLQKRGEGGWK